MLQLAISCKEIPLYQLGSLWLTYWSSPFSFAYFHYEGYLLTLPPSHNTRQQDISTNVVEASGKAFILPTERTGTPGTAPSPSFRCKYTLWTCGSHAATIRKRPRNHLFWPIPATYEEYGFKICVKTVFLSNSSGGKSLLKLNINLNIFRNYTLENVFKYI